MMVIMGNRFAGEGDTAGDDGNKNDDYVGDNDDAENNDYGDGYDGDTCY